MGPRKTVEELGRQSLADGGLKSNDFPSAKEASKEVASGDATRNNLELAGLTPELERKYKKLFEGYKPVKYFGYEFQAPLVWRNIILISLIHVLGIIGCYKTAYASSGTWYWFVALYMFGGLGVTAGAHRLWTHRSYKAHFLLRIFLMLMDTICFQNDLIEWSRDHRTHHKYSETDADPHNAKRGFFFAHVGWLMMKKHPQVIIKGQGVDMSDLRADPVVMFQHRFFVPFGLLIAFIIPTVVPWYFWDESLFTSFCMCTMTRYMFHLNVTWLVNSAAHLWGSRPYDKGINPAENLFVAFAVIGEGFHNYHHAFPYDYSTSELGPWFNLSTVFIDLMAMLGLAWDRKKVSSKAIQARKKRTGVLKGENTTEEEQLALQKELHVDY